MPIPKALNDPCPQYYLSKIIILAQRVVLVLVFPVVLLIISTHKAMACNCSACIEIYIFDNFFIILQANPHQFRYCCWFPFYPYLDFVFAQLTLFLLFDILFHAITLSLVSSILQILEYIYNSVPFMFDFAISLQISQCCHVPRPILFFYYSSL